MTQDEALALLKTGVGLFLTGEPGSGKTHTVNRYIAYLRGKNVSFAYTASTGIAATHGHGVTIHAWSGIGVRDSLTPRDLDGLAANKRLVSRVEKTRVLIIDEISMLPARSLDLVDKVCRHIRSASAPFGGLQIVLAGDFFQLPPILSRGQPSGTLSFPDGAGGTEAGFAHASAAWKDLAPTVCYLSEQHRQNDRAFLGVLAAIRGNDCGAAERGRLAARMIGRDQLPAGCTLLFTHNASVDAINDQELAKLKAKAHMFAMSTKGPEPLVVMLKRGCLSPETLALKQGAVVMFTKNDASGRFVNGTLGVVEGFYEDGNPVVRTHAGKRIVAEPATWKIEENGRERASITQIPLRLAWAITVHKSQGMSLDAAVIDLSRAFEYGQGYVALSRVRRLEGLHLLGLNERALRVHPLAVEKDTEFRALSELARRSLSALGAAALRERQGAFAGASAARSEGPQPGKRARTSRAGEPKAYDLGGVRTTHQNAYAPWSDAEESDLRRRRYAGESVEAIAAGLGRKPGAVRARLKKLALM